MDAFEFAQQYNTIEEKTAVLLLGAMKMAYNMAGLDFDSLTDDEKMEAINRMIFKEA